MTALFYGHIDKLAYAVLVEHLEGVYLQDLLFKVNRQEAGDVVARITEGHLREVVRTEAEIFGASSNLVGREGCTRNFNHCTNLERNFNAFFLEEFGSFLTDYFFLSLELVEDTREGHHDFGMRVEAFALQVDAGAENGTGLHLRDAGISIAETAAAVAEHRVVLAEAVNALTDIFYRYAHSLGHFFLTLQVVGHELVEGRIEQANVYGEAVHSTEDALEVFFLNGEKFGKSLLATFNVFGKNHLAHGNNLVSIEEHVLRAAETDTYSTELAGYFCVVGRVGVGAHLQAGVLGAEVHKVSEVAGQFGSLRADFTLINAAVSTVERNEIAFLKLHTVDFKRLCLVVNIDCACTADAALTHTAGNYGSVAGHTAASGEDTFCGSHAGEVFGRSLDTYEYHLMAIGAPLCSVFGKEDNLTAGSTRAGGKTAREFLSLCKGFFIEHGVQEFVELGGLAAVDSRLFVDHALTEQVHGNLHHGCAGALTVTRLQEPEFAFLNGELHVLHVVVVVFEFGLDSVELLVDFGHSLFHRGELCFALFFRNALQFCPAARAFERDLLRRADTCHNVLTLCINEPFAVEEVFARSGVAAEANARCGGVAHVAEYHCHYRHGRTPFCGNAFHLAVKDSALVHPRVEHGADSTPELFHGVSGECLARLLGNSFLEEGYKTLEVFRFELVIEFHALFFLHLLDDFFKGILVVLVYGLHAEHYVAIHLYEAAICVVGEAGIASLCCETLNHFVVKTEVKNGVHHAGHRSACAGAYGEEQGVLHIAELALHQVFHVVETLLNFCLENFYDLVLADFVVLIANVGRNGKSRGHGYTDEVHLGKVGTLTAQFVTHVGTALSLTVTERVNSFFVLHRFYYLQYIIELKISMRRAFGTYTQIHASDWQPGARLGDLHINIGVHIRFAFQRNKRERHQNGNVPV